MFDQPPAETLRDLLSQVGGAIDDATAQIAAASDEAAAAGAGHVEVIAVCERISRMVDAAQLAAIDALETRRHSTHPPADPQDPSDVRRATDRVHRSVRAEVSMARGVSTGAAEYSQILARGLRHHPRTRALLAAGRISTAVAAAVCRESSALSTELQRRLDTDLAEHLPNLTLREAGTEARRLALALDAAAAEERAIRARAKRRVRLRREADAMATLSITGTAEDVIAAWNRLSRQALSTQAAGLAAGRNQQQLASDFAVTLLRSGALTSSGLDADVQDDAPTEPADAAQNDDEAEPDDVARPDDEAEPGDVARPGEAARRARATEPSEAAAEPPQPPPRPAPPPPPPPTPTPTPTPPTPPTPREFPILEPVAPAPEIGLLMRPEVLFGKEDTPAVLVGYGPIPAGLARLIATEAAERDSAWIRRLFVSSGGERIVEVDPRRRRFPADVARLIRAADNLCMRPSCDNDVRDLDHVQSHARGGTSTADNGQGTCQDDNLAKEIRAWNVVSSGSESDGLIEAFAWTTPTGHTYTGHRSGPEGRLPTRIVSRTAPHPQSPLEHRLHRLTRRRLQ